MRHYEDKEKKIITQKECVMLSCDMCKRKAEYPNNEDRGAFEWGAVGTGHGQLLAGHSIDGESENEELDLCEECASWLILQIKRGEFKRPSIAAMSG